MRVTVASLIVAMIIVGCSAPAGRDSPAQPQVLFVCEHGNVKSLMAASYFNQRVSELGLPYRAISRGSAPDSTTVPPAIVAQLRNEGFDVAEFHPVAVTLADVAESRRVILINTDLPEDARSSKATLAQWTDVPAASLDYAAASDALKRHIEELIADLAQPATR